MAITNLIRFIFNHPLNSNNKFKSLFRFIRWQISSRLNKGSYILEWIDDSKLVVENGMTGATGNIYVGLMEYKDMGFLLHYLNENHIFYDIGANVGVYTVLASKVKGSKTISIEPLPKTFEKLIDNVNVNRINDRVISKNIGLSYESGRLNFTNNLDTMNSVSDTKTDNTTEVDVFTLDSVAERFGIPDVIKMDVEGFETNVIKGGKNTIKNEKFGVLIIELNGSGTTFGFDENDIHYFLLNEGFKAYDYDPFDRKLLPLDSFGSHNTLYIRDSIINEVKSTIKSSKKSNVKITNTLL